MHKEDIELLLLDFGGVIAEEGFQEGLYHLARQSGLEPESFFQEVRRMIFETGYLTGQAPEHVFWEAVRGLGVSGTDRILRQELLSRFQVRGWMLDMTTLARKQGIKVAILSDQTNWLDELDMKHGFSRGFDAVFNSYHIHATKHEPGFFHTALEQMQTAPGATLFVDDSAANVDVARSAGLAAIHYRDRDSFFAELSGYLPGIAEQVAKQVTRAEKGAIQ